MAKIQALLVVNVFYALGQNSLSGSLKLISSFVLGTGPAPGSEAVVYDLDWLIKREGEFHSGRGCFSMRLSAWLKSRCGASCVRYSKAPQPSHLNREPEQEMRQI